MVSVLDVFALVARVPLAFLPGITWAVVTWTALDVYQLFGFELMLVDYIVAPLLLMYIIYLAWKRDSWAGLVGAVMGIVLSLVGESIGMSAAAFVVEEFGSVIMWAVFIASEYMLMMFIIGLVAGVFAPLTALVSGAMALMIYAYNTYVDYLLEVAYRAVHRATHELHAGVHVLAGVGAAAVLGVLDAAMATFMLLLIGAYTAGVLIAGALSWGLSIVIHAISIGLAVVASRSLYHYAIFSFAVSAVVMHYLHIASVGAGWLAAVVLLFSRRWGHVGYSALAASAAAAAATMRMNEIISTIIKSIMGK